LALLASLAGCKDDTAPASSSATTPTATASAAAIACDGKGKVNDASNVAALPETTGDFCLDPNASDRGYGEGAKNPLDAVRGLFDGEWSAYEQLGIKRVVEARYVDGKGGGATLDVKLSTFRDSGAAYAMFTRRVVGDGDPAHPDSPKPIEGGGRAALGWGNAFVWRGPHLAEIMYNDAGGASDKAIKAKGDELLPALSKALGDKLSGARELPKSAAALPEEGRLPLGVRYLTEEVAGVTGTGEGAFGYYADGDRRWRVMSIVKGDDEQAKDVFKSFSRVEGAVEEEGLGTDAVRLMIRLAGAQTEWLVARHQARVVGVGDEPRVLRRGMSAEEHRRRTLPLDDKRERLRALLD
jgi:hypothetical protein